MPGQHARLSPSGSHRWLTCAGSIVLESAFPNNSNEWSDSGTAMHALAGIHLVEGGYATAAVGQQVKVSDVDVEPVRTVLFTQEHAETVNDYIDTIRALTKGLGLHVEQRVDFTEYVLPGRGEERIAARLAGKSELWIDTNLPLQFGTMDAQWLNPLEDPTTFELCICDLKTGFRFVPIEGNTQLMLYALGCLSRYELSHDIRSIRLMIYQPQHGGMRESVITIEELMAFAAVAKIAAQKVEAATASRVGEYQAGGAKAAYWEKAFLNPDPNEDDCAFCRAMSTCPAKRAKFERVVGAAFDVIEVAGPVDATTMDEPRLSEAMRVTGELEDWIKAVRAETERRLLLGIPVEGFGLELGREGARNWKDEEAAKTYLRKTMRLPIEKAFHLKLISPTDAEKLAGYKQGKKVAKPKEPPVISERQWKGMQANIKRAPPVPSVKAVSQITKPYTPIGPDDSSFEAIDENPAADLI
jgi:hypothetical protein